MKLVRELLEELRGFCLVLILVSIMGALDYTTPYEQNQQGVNGELLPFVTRFQKEARVYLGVPFIVPDMNIHFQRQIDGPAIAWCLRDAHKQIFGYVLYTRKPRIMVDKDVWDSLSPYEKEQLMFHELGHCTLQRDHLDTVVNNKQISLMHSAGFIEDAYYIVNRKRYLTELFTGPLDEKTKK